MKYTNKYGLPMSIVRAVQADPYSKGDADFSVTELLKPPQLGQLYREHESELSEDVSDSIWKLLGQGVHSVLEKAYSGGDAVLEERVFSQVEASMMIGFQSRPWTISGAIDLRYGRKITDYKVTATYTYIRGDFKDWTAQLNMYDWLLWMDGVKTVEELEVVVILRDWMKSQKHKSNYPEAPVVVIPIDRWTHKFQEEFIEERLELHTAKDVRPCTQEETWDGIRCRSWCPVSSFCSQYLGAK